MEAFGFAVETYRCLGGHVSGGHATGRPQEAMHTTGLGVVAEVGNI